MRAWSAAPSRLPVAAAPAPPLHATCHRDWDTQRRFTDNYALAGVIADPNLHFGRNSQGKDELQKAAAKLGVTAAVEPAELPTDAGIPPTQLSRDPGLQQLPRILARPALPARLHPRPPLLHENATAVMNALL